MAAMKSEHDEEAEWSENMTNEIKQLQQRVLTVKEKQKRETLTMHCLYDDILDRLYDDLC